MDERRERGYRLVGAVWAVARSEMRRRWGSLAVATLLVVIVGGVVLATTAGARRSTTALARFDAYSRASTIELDTDATTTPAQVTRFARTPGVVAVAMLHAYGQQVEGQPNLQIAAALDTRLGTVVDRPRLVAGRRARPDALDEITVGEPLAHLAHLRIGDSLVADSLTPEQIAAAEHGTNPGGPQGPRVTFHVVGLVRRPLDLGDRAASGGVVLLSPAFDRVYRHRIGIFTTVLRVRTLPSSTVKARVTAAAQRAFGGSPVFQATDLSRENGGATSAIDVVTLTLWVFAAVSASAGAIAVGVVMSREVSRSAQDHPTLQALGATRPTRVAIAFVPACVATAVGVLGAAVLAVLASPLLPIGIARRADPSPGFHVDWVVIGLGTLALAVVVLSIALLAAVRTSRVMSASRTPRAGRPWLSERLARAGFSPSFTNGVRMTFERQPGDRSLPTRPAFAGAILGVAGVVAVVVLATSLGHLAATPRLYGWTFDFKAPDDTFSTSCGTSDRTDYGLHAVKGVSAVATVCFGNVRVDDRATTGWALTPVRGSIGPEVVAGRAPRGAGEVALGRATLDALHKHVGDSVRANEERPARSYRIVGQVAFPRIYGQDLQPLADGAVFTTAGFRPLTVDNENLNRYVVGRFTSGVDRRAVLARVSRMPAFNPVQGQNALMSDAGAHTASVPPEITRLRDVGWFAPALGALLALLALVAVGHALVMAVRRRRREFAVLKTIGFRRRQVRATIAWHATLLALVGLVVGVPLGLVVGRFAWKLIAEDLGITTVPWFPVAAATLTVVLVLAVVNLLALLPARAAATTRPALALRAE